MPRAASPAPDVQSASESPSQVEQGSGSAHACGPPAAGGCHQSGALCVCVSPRGRGLSFLMRYGTLGATLTSVPHHRVVPGPSYHPSERPGPPPCSPRALGGTATVSVERGSVSPVWCPALVPTGQSSQVTPPSWSSFHHPDRDNDNLPGSMSESLRLQGCSGCLGRLSLTS